MSIAALLLGWTMLTACGNDDPIDYAEAILDPTISPDPDPGPAPQPTPVEEEKKPVDVSLGVYVIGAGNQQNQINGSLTYYNYENDSTATSVFIDVNGRYMGVTANDGVIYGSKFYVVVDSENSIEVMNAQTCQSIKRLSTTELLGEQEGVSPRHIVAHDGNIYVSTYGGYVAVIDTTDYSLKQKLQAGSYPEGMAFSGKMLFVANCDYGRGENASISIINSETGAKIIDLTDDLINNPTMLVADGYDLYILCGDTYDPDTWEVKQKGGLRKYTMQGMGGTITEVNNAGIIAAHGELMYCIMDPYGTPEYKVLNIKSGEERTFTTDGVDIPNAMGVDPLTGEVFILSYIKNPETGYGNYSAPGYAARYDTAGNKTSTFLTGVGPCAMVFKKGVRYE